tara:strand:+ start:548 stop:1234 length:687 start_codon:yes stop_codon:yes gene_type:complete
MKKDNWVKISTSFTNEKIKAVFSLKSSAIGQEASRQSFAKAVGFNSKRLIIPQQTHSNNIIFCESERKIPNCDGAFSDSSKNVCSIQVADCMPIYFAHKSEIVFGLIHAGWRGLVNGILSKSAFTLTEKKYNLMEFEILIGPSIQSCCFEVSNDVVDQFDRRFIIPKSDEKFQVDLQQSAYNSLSQLGFDINKITIMNDCTFCLDSMYHSYRRNGKNAGRMIGLIGIK